MTCGNRYFRWSMGRGSCAEGAVENILAVRLRFAATRVREGSALLADWRRGETGDRFACLTAGHPSTITSMSAPQEPLAVLVSGGLDSAVLLGRAARERPAVHPLYVRTGLAWEATELDYLHRFLNAIRTPA